LKRYLPIALLVLQALVFFRHVLFLPGYAIPWDLRGLHLPHAYLWADSLAKGLLPLWDPYTYCGRPDLANIQAGALYPAMPVVAAMGLVFGHDTLLYWLECTVVLHVALAGIFGFLLLRALGVKRTSAYFGATTYQLCGFFAAHAEHLGTTIAAAWLPFALLSVYRWHKERSWRAALLLTAALALTILAGHAPLAAVVVAACFLFGLLLAILDGGGLSILVMTAVASLCAALLSLAQLAPTYQLTNLSVAQFRADYLGSGGGVPATALVSLVRPNYYHIFEPAQYKLPDDLTYMYLYCGILGLLFGLAGVVLAGWSRLNRVFAILLLCGTFATLGDTTWMGRMALSLVPLRIKISLEPEISAAVLCLSLAVLAALALDRLVPNQRLACVLAVAAAVDLIAVSSGRPMNAYPVAAEPGVGRTHIDGRPETLQRMLELTGTSFPPSRVDTVDAALAWSTTAPITRIYTANGADVMAVYRTMQARLAFAQGQRWGAYYQIENLRSPVIGLMNTRLVISSPRLDARRLAGSPFRELTSIPGGYIYENQAVLPRFFLVSRLRPARNLEEAAALLKSPDFDPKHEAIVEGAPGPPPPAGEPAGMVSVSKYGLQQLRLSVESERPAYLVTSETHYPGWRAYVDGRPQPIYYTNVAFRGFPVPAGRHQILMRFEAPLFWWAAAASALGWIVWAALLLWGRLTICGRLGAPSGPGMARSAMGTF
jgi:hypothetical protein